MRTRTSLARTVTFATAVLITSLGFLAGPVHAKRAPDPSTRARLPRLYSAPDLAEDAVGVVRLESGAELQFGTSGLLRRYWLRQPSTLARSVAPRDVATEFLGARAGALGLAAGQPERDLRFDGEKTSPSGTHLRWQQTVDGVPVWRGDLVLKVSPRGEVSSVQNNLKPGLGLDTRPSIDQTKAISNALAAIGPTGKAIGDFKASLAVLPLAGGARLVWIATLPLESPAGDWRVFVDAGDGSIVAVEDAMIYDTGSGQVFDPDPMSKMGDSTFVDNADANSSVPFPAAYDIRTLEGITLSAGIYSLDGPYARLIDNESPVQAPVTATHPDSFRFQRSAQGFEDVMCYFQLDQSQRYIQGLGFSNVNNRVQEVDSHGLSGADNSHYVPSTKRLAFGEGGIDDAEDADVIWHEYGHSIQDNIVPGWGGGQEGQMGEGFGDYWAGSYSLSLYPAFQPVRVFTWDGNGETWSGRPLIDASLHYPEDCCGEVHDSGTLWCSALMDCWWNLGRIVMDRLVLDHTFALGTSATMADAANQIIQSDIDLYGGAHVSTLVARFGFWGMVNPANFVPTISHTPLTDTENTTGPYPVVATITSVEPLDTSSLKVYWGLGAITDSIPMTATGNPNEYSASIPGPLSGVDVRYYLRARDLNGGTSTSPSGAPASFHQFHVGADGTPPVIAHTPIGNTPQLQWPKSVTATVTDNLGVNTSSVLVTWTLNAVPKTGFPLTRVGLTSVYVGTFPGVQADVNPGDVVTYHIDAQDIATVPNSARSPASGEHTFSITASLGLVLVLDDDEVAKQPEDGSSKPGADKTRTIAAGNSVTPGGEVESAIDIASILNGLGYVASVESSTASNPATWTGYSFIVSSSGANTSPVASAPYRSALEAYVAGGGKLLVEGGEVVYDAASSPGYPSFAANVLHASNWAADNAGNLQRLVAQAAHPIATVPNALPVTLPLAYSGFGSEDSYAAVAPAYIVYAVTSQPANGGLLVYDPTPPPQGGQIVVFGFDIKALGDLTLRTNLLQNTAAYLTASEGVPNGSISGLVHLANLPDRSGVTVSGGGASTTTATTGEFTLTGLYAGSYTLSFAKAGFRTETRTVVVTQSQLTSGVNVTLYPVPTQSACVDPALAIPDNNVTGVSSNLPVSATFNVASITVDAQITHTYIGDLIVELRHGAKSVRLHNRTGGSTHNISGNWPGTLAVDGPGTLSDFIGDPAGGTWTLFISDNANIDTGTLTHWCVNITGPADTTITVGVEGASLPAVAALLPAAPNPMRGTGGTLRFTLPHRAPVTLGIYDVSGRLVRSLLDGGSEAGVQTAHWDGRDARGGQVAAGVYLARFRTGKIEQVQRLVLLH